MKTNPFYNVEMPAFLSLPGHVHPAGEPAPEWARDPYRPHPNPATGELVVDPEISLTTKGGSLDISLFYNSTSNENFAYGQGRTISLESYMISYTDGSGSVSLVR